MKRKLVIFTGAGISKESGIRTFRDEDGTWENYKIEEVATPIGWKKDREKVIRFYNERWEQLKTVHPNRAHEICVELEKDYDVTVVTQNVDDLHERAGSSTVHHLHGNLFTLRSTRDPNVIVPWTEPLTLESKAENGDTLRPNVVWFTEGLNLDIVSQAMQAIWEADAVIIVGTSLNVEPAASMPAELREEAPLIYVDPSATEFKVPEWKKDLYHKVEMPATTGMQEAADWIGRFFKAIDCRHGAL